MLMNSTPTPLIAQVFFGLLTASVLGSAIYLFWRFLSKIWLDGIYWLGLPVATFSFLACLNGFLLNLFYFPLFMVFVCLGGGFFHRKSMDSSSPKFGDFFLILVASFSNAFVGLSVVFELEIDVLLRPFFDGRVEFFYFLYLVVCPAIVPALLLAGKSMKLRPGIDTPLED